MLLRLSLIAGMIIPGAEFKNGQIGWAILTLLLLLVALVMAESMERDSGRSDI